MGWSTGLAPRASSSRTSNSLWSDARVMRISLPARGDAEASATLSSHFFEDGLRAGFDEQAGNMFAESDGLVGRRRRALPHILRTVDGADASFEHKFAALGARPRAERNLAATLKRGEERAL